MRSWRLDREGALRLTTEAGEEIRIFLTEGQEKRILSALRAEIQVRIDASRVYIDGLNSGFVVNSPRGMDAYFLAGGKAGIASAENHKDLAEKIRRVLRDA